MDVPTKRNNSADEIPPFSLRLFSSSPAFVSTLLPFLLSLSLSFRFLSTFLSSSPPPTAVSLISRLSIYFVRLVRCPGPFLGWLCLTQTERRRRRRRRRAIPCWGDNEKRRKSTRGGRRSRRRRGKEEKKKEERKERNMEGEKKREEKSARKVFAFPIVSHGFAPERTIWIRYRPVAREIENDYCEG